MNTERKRIHVLRHAQPGKDPETQRSLDYITEQGKTDAEALGASLYAGYEGAIAVVHSPMFRAYQTGNRMMEGARKVPIIVQPNENLGMGFFNDAKNKPSGIPYGPEFINAFVEANPEAVERVAVEMSNFVKQAYRIGNKLEGDSTVIGTSHGPKVEIGYGTIISPTQFEMGISLANPVDFGQFAANPLDGFVVELDRAQKSGNILEARIKFKDLESQTLRDNFYLR